MDCRRSAIVAAIGALLCSGTPGGAGVSDRTITVMSYNAENLFDTQDNPANKGDNTFLPLSQKGTPAHKAICDELETASQKRECLELDWSDEVLAAKLRNLATVIDNFDGGRGPDILMLQETENLNVLRMLKAALKNSAAYITVVNEESSPGRGINVALLSKLPTAGPVKTHKIEFTGADATACGTTRDLLEVPLRLPDGSSVSMLGLHFPSGSNPVQCREFAAERLNDVARGRPKGTMLIALGDTNINCTPEDQQVIADVLKQQWIVPDELNNKGCRPPGTEFFPSRGQWSFLDLIMASRSLSSSSQEGASWFTDFGSFRTVISAPEVQVETDDKGRVKPLRFDPQTRTGSADHWPVAIDLIRRR